ncbi:helix-turn-helix transcriptional regulator [Pseudomonas sp. WS 5019]|nr:helix-turn-helix transcriptional regulator [Pseudomonas sp. WS 5019]NMY14281.1 helix-turn-helix transcriptional regulator [Pseudomonas sp. WS 5019]
MRTKLLREIKERREKLGIKTSAMLLLAGIKRQQYEKIEKSGNPSLSTLDKIVEGLDAEIMLIPKEHLAAVRKLLSTTSSVPFKYEPRKITLEDFDTEVTDPWPLIEDDKNQ